ncbi:MAG: hypothetical protein ABJF10_25130 [Chthoniobacter sp.]|uniref:hypothetical protein n=1 Tax=Chthoniobacter sp. TaxID=2510640 RepID=UPI0032AC27B7
MNHEPITGNGAAIPGARHRRARVPARRRGIRHHAFRLALLCLAASFPALAGDPLASSVEGAKQNLQDLTFSNFFSSGWNGPWTRRSRGDNTPDMSLLRVQTNFVTAVFRLDYAYQQNLATAGVRGTDALTGTFEFPFNRRFELGIVGYYNWVDSRKGEDINGGTEGAFARLAWVDTATSSLATNIRVAFPNHDLGGRDTTISVALAGWHDLAPLGLKGVGLYGHLQEETLAGPYAVGSRRNDLTYDISLVRTWTKPGDFLGNASTFVEAYGVTDLDGRHRGHTVITLTPGFRATIARRHIFMAGVDFPVTEPNPFERIFRFTYIYCF